MKCDELKEIDDLYERRMRNGSDPYKIKLVDVRHPPVYLKTDVDAAIAELKEKLHDAEMRADLAECAETERKIDYDKLKAENRRLKRALYKACANWAYATEVNAANFLDVKEARKWASVYYRCIKKAEEYK